MNEKFNLVQIEEPKNEIAVEREKENLWFSKTNSKIKYRFNTRTGVFMKEKHGEMQNTTRSSIDSWFRGCAIITEDEQLARLIMIAGGKTEKQVAAFARVIETLFYSWSIAECEEWENAGVKLKEVTEILEDGGLNLSHLPSLHYISARPKNVSKNIRKYIKSKGPISINELSDLCKIKEEDIKIIDGLEKAAQESPELFETEEYQYGRGTYKTVSILDTHYQKSKLVRIIKNYNIDIERFMQYLHQLKNWEHTNINWVISNYNDYLRAELYLKNGRKSKMDKYPSNLVQAHHNKTSIMAEMEREKERLKQEKQKELDRAIYENTKQFEYCPEGEDYCIIAPKDAEDVFREGDKQNHCVGTYTKRISNKQSVILFMRRNKKMDEPLITIEINPSSGFNLCQALGRNNRRATAKERRFLEKYCDTHKVYDDNGKEASIFYTAYSRL